MRSMRIAVNLPKSFGHIQKLFVHFIVTFSQGVVKGESYQNTIYLFSAQQNHLSNMQNPDRRAFPSIGPSRWGQNGVKFLTDERYIILPHYFSIRSSEGYCIRG